MSLVALLLLLPAAAEGFVPSGAAPRPRPRAAAAAPRPIVVTCTARSAAAADEAERCALVAEAAARAAGAAIVRGDARGGDARLSSTKFNGRDLVTETDKAAQSAALQTLARLDPEALVLGEEDVAPGRDASIAACSAALADAAVLGKVLYIVDPLDGTTNFCHGMPLSSVSISAVRGGEIIAGVVFDPFRDELFAAYRGGLGTTLNGGRVVTTRDEALSDAVILAGAPPDPRSAAPAARGIAAVMPKCRTIRMLGSAALMYAWVACGRCSAYFEHDLSSWDVSAGALLVQEAGGTVVTCAGDPYALEERSILAASGTSLSGELVDVLAEAGASHYDEP